MVVLTIFQFWTVFPFACIVCLIPPCPACEWYHSALSVIFKPDLKSWQHVYLKTDIIYAVLEIRNTVKHLEFVKYWKLHTNQSGKQEGAEDESVLTVDELVSCCFLHTAVSIFYPCVGRSANSVTGKNVYLKTMTLRPMYELCIHWFTGVHYNSILDCDI